MEFDFNKYIKNNPLLKETNGVGNYVQPRKMFGSPDLDTQDSHTGLLGPDEELMEGGDEVNEVFNEMMSRMRELIKSKKLDSNDVQKLRVKLAEFFK